MESQDYSYHNQDEPVVGPVRVLGHDASDAHHVSGTSISRGWQGRVRGVRLSIVTHQVCPDLHIICNEF